MRAQNERLARDLAILIDAGSGSPLAIVPSSQVAGRVRVKLPEADLDPVSVVRLFEVVRDALPTTAHALPGEAPAYSSWCGIAARQ